MHFLGISWLHSEMFFFIKFRQIFIQEAGPQVIAETEMIGITTHQQLFVTIIFVQVIAKILDKMEAIVRRTNVFASNKSTNPKYKLPWLQAIIRLILLKPNYLYSCNKLKVSKTINKYVVFSYVSFNKVSLL